MSDAAPRAPLTIVLAGDVMTGRGVDQLFRTSSAPELREQSVRSAADYVSFAEQAHGPIRTPVDARYVWGDALRVLEELKPDATIVNLETSITRSNDFYPRKEVHYRMHPSNVTMLQAAGVDACALANNHVLDFGRSGLLDTLDALHGADIRTAGAGRDLAEACAPARIDLGGGASLLLFAFGCESSGIPRDWAAGPSRSGVHLLDDLSTESADAVAAQVRANKRPGDIAIASVHWGSNWGYEIDPEQEAFAHRLVEAGIDIVHGHSSHHVRPVEVHAGKLILYGCGDLVNDYEGITGYEEWRGDLGALYVASVAPHDGSLAALRVVPMHMRRMRLAHPARADEQLLADILTRISRPYRTRFTWRRDGAIELGQPAGAPP